MSTTSIIIIIIIIEGKLIIIQELAFSNTIGDIWVEAKGHVGCDLWVLWLVSFVTNPTLSYASKI